MCMDYGKIKVKFCNMINSPFRINCFSFLFLYLQIHFSTEFPLMGKNIFLEMIFLYKNTPKSVGHGDGENKLV